MERGGGVEVNGRFAIAAVVAVVMLAVIFGGSRLLHRRPVGLNPWNAMTVVWTACVILYLVNPFGLTQIHADTWLLLVAAFACFTAGYWLVTLTRETLGPLPEPGSIRIIELGSQRWRRLQLLMLGSVIWFAIFLAVFLFGAISRYGPNPLTFVARLRLSLSEGDTPAGYYYFYAAQLLVPLGVLLWRHGRPQRTRYLVVSGVSFASLWFTSGRTNLVIAATWTLAALALERGGRPVRARAVAGAVGVLVTGLFLFVLMGDAIGKTYGNSSLAGGGNGFVPVPLVIPYIYLVGSLPALDQVIHENPATQRPTIPKGYSIRFIYQIQAFLGRDVRVPAGNLPYWSIPFSFNTATFLEPLAFEYGQGWSLVIVFFIGCLSAGVYVRWLSRPDVGSLLLVSLCIAVLLQSPIALRTNELWFLVSAAILFVLVRAEKRTSSVVRRRARHPGGRPVPLQRT